MKLIFYGQLRELYGPSATMQATSIADAIEGFSRQQGNWPRDLPISVVGYDTPEKLTEAPDEIHLLPTFRGGAGKYTNIIIGAALIVIGTLLMSTPFGVPLIVSGSVMVLMGVVGLFMKAPTLGKNQDPEASKYLAINRNTTAVGTLITLAWGRIDLAGHWLSLQSDSNNLSYGVFPTNPT